LKEDTREGGRERPARWPSGPSFLSFFFCLLLTHHPIKDKGKDDVKKTVKEERKKGRKTWRKDK